MSVGSYARISFYEASTTGESDWKRPAQCQPGETEVPFHKQRFEVLTTGEYTIRSDQKFDGSLFLFRQDFDASIPSSNCIDSNDDASGFDPENDFGSELASVLLERETTYFLITSAGAGGAGGEFRNTVEGPGIAVFIPEQRFDRFANRNWTFSHVFENALEEGGTETLTVDGEFRFSGLQVKPRGQNFLDVLDGTGTPVGEAVFSKLAGHLLFVDDDAFSYLYALRKVTPTLLQGTYTAKRRPGGKTGLVNLQSHWPLDLVIDDQVFEASGLDFASAEGAVAREAIDLPEDSNDPPFWTEVEAGESVDFTKLVSLGGLSEFSIVFWFRAEMPVERELFRYGTPDTTSMVVSILESGVIEVVETIPGSEPTIVQIQNPIEGDGWHQVVVGRQASVLLLMVDDGIVYGSETPDAAPYEFFDQASLGSDTYAGDLARFRVYESWIERDGGLCLFESDGQACSGNLVAALVGNSGSGSGFGVLFASTQPISGLSGSVALVGSGATFSTLSAVTSPLGSSGDVTGVPVGIQGTNSAPIARDDLFQVEEGTTLEANVLINDNDPEGATLSAIPAESDLPGLAADGTFQFVPDVTGVERREAFRYAVTDGELSAEATVRIDILPAETNDPPIANDDLFQVNFGDQLQANVLDNDADPNGDTLAVVFTDLEATTNAGLANDGSLVFTPTENRDAQLTFTYEVSDSWETDTATVTIITRRVATNTAPVATDDELVLALGASASINVLDNDFDPDGDALMVVPDGVVSADGEFTLLSVEGPPRTEFVTYRVTDGELEDTGTLRITVLPAVTTPGQAQFFQYLCAVFGRECSD